VHDFVFAHKDLEDRDNRQKLQREAVWKNRKKRGKEDGGIDHDAAKEKVNSHSHSMSSKRVEYVSGSSEV